MQGIPTHFALFQLFRIVPSTRNKRKVNKIKGLRSFFSIKLQSYLILLLYDSQIYFYLYYIVFL